MTFVRPVRRVLIAAASMSALFVAAACGGGGGGGGAPEGGGTSAPAADFTKQGDIEFWTGKDTSGNLPKLIAKFNESHPNGKVTLHELPDEADQQRQQMIQNTQIKNPKMAVLNVDVVWTAEFAANSYVEPLPPDQFPTDGMLKATIDSATYFDQLYAYPWRSNGGLLFYRKDLLDKYSLEVPTTFDEMKAACDKITAGENNPKLACFAGQYNKYEGLTVNFDEAVHGAGGVIVGDDGKPNVATPEATQGLQTLTDWFKDGHIPKAAITWTEEEGRKAFQDGELIFHRNWPYVYAFAAKTDGSSKVNGKFAVAPLPGITQPGVSSLGGGNLGVAKNAENKGTAADFLKFMASADSQESDTLATGNAPVLESVYSDPDVLKKYPFFPTLLESIQTAKPRPKAVQYGDVTLAIQDAAYGALQGQTQPDAALQALQAKLQTLIK
jgi:multiple sugar transport system substrate-binding protein